jgi:hypothetical protein
VFSGGCCVSVHLEARFPPIVWHTPRARIQDRMARMRSASAEATTAHASTPPLAPEPANPSASVVQPSAGTGTGASVPEVEDIASGVFEVSLEGLRASMQDRSAMKDTGSRHGQGRSSPARAEGVIVGVLDRQPTKGSTRSR